MRILFLTLGSPLRPDRGAQLRDHELIVRVARRERVSVLPVLEPGHPLGSDHELERHCELLAPVVVDASVAAKARRAVRHLLDRRPLASLPYIDRGLLSAVASVARRGRFDLVQVEHSFLAPCVAAVPPDSRRVISLHNLGHHQYLSMVRAERSPVGRATLRAKGIAIRRLELEHIPRFDGVVVVSEPDRQRLAELGPAPPVAVVPNGVDLERFQLLPGEGTPGTMLFVGNLAYRPNAQAVIEFCRWVLPRVRERVPGARLIVVGPRPPAAVRALAGEAVEITGPVADLRPLYARARLAIVPLLAGGGTRLKVLEAMALGRCVISTPLGVEGLAVADGREVLLAEPGAQFARAVERAFADAELRRAVVRRARAFVERDHGWEGAAQRLLEFYERLAARCELPARARGRSRGGREPRTSVIIPAYRATATLPAVLDALEPQIGPGREAILVQSAVDGHGPGSPARRPWLRVVSTPERLWPGQARNLGAAHARGELLAFLDADSVPSAHWLERLERSLGPEHEAVAGAIVNGTPASIIGTAEYLLTCSEAFPRRPRAIRHGPGANLLVRRRYLEAVGGFSERWRAAEDTIITFPLARQGRLGFAPDARVAHLNRTRLAPFLTNQRLQGQAFVRFCRTVRYPHRWVARGPGLPLAGLLRLGALARCLAHNPDQARQAPEALPLLVLGTAAWLAGALDGQAQRRRDHPPSSPIKETAREEARSDA